MVEIVDDPFYADRSLPMPVKWMGCDADCRRDARGWCILLCCLVLELAALLAADVLPVDGQTTGNESSSKDRPSQCRPSEDRLRQGVPVDGQTIDMELRSGARASGRGVEELVGTPCHGAET
jgi:hypothetical protein